MVELRQDWFTPFDEMRREMDRLVDDFSSGRTPAFRFSRRSWEPLIDIYETTNTVVVVAELAGLKEEDIEVLVLGSNLLIRGIRGDSAPRGQRSYYQIEIRRGPFERENVLPVPVDPEQTNAYYENGLLQVVMAKAGETGHNS